jgi:hypothetical protein
VVGLFPQIACHGPPQESAPSRRTACAQNRAPSRSGSLQMNFLPSHDVKAFGSRRPLRTSRRSSRFSPPDCYQLSQAGTSSLLRIHLPPCTASFDLEFPLESPYPQPARNDTRLPQLLRAPCKLPHPQSLNRSDQVSGFALFCTLTHQLSRIRFTCAMCSLLPIASFRPCRCRQRPCDSDCLPLGRGDACFFQQAGFARYAGQTKR